jgi:hypothetical protein
MELLVQQRNLKEAFDGTTNRSFSSSPREGSVRITLLKTNSAAPRREYLDLEEKTEAVGKIAHKGIQTKTSGVEPANRANLAGRRIP